MRVKSILPIFVFFFLFSLVALPQQKDPKPAITFSQIADLIIGTGPVDKKIDNLGYKRIKAPHPYTYSNGEHVFTLSNANAVRPFYTEKYFSPEREATLKKQALEYGLELGVDDKEMLQLSGKRFVFTSYRGDRIEIFWKK